MPLSKVSLRSVQYEHKMKLTLTCQFQQHLGEVISQILEIKSQFNNYENDPFHHVDFMLYRASRSFRRIGHGVLWSIDNTTLE